MHIQCKYFNGEKLGEGWYWCHRFIFRIKIFSISFKCIAMSNNGPLYGLIIEYSQLHIDANTFALTRKAPQICCNTFDAVYLHPSWRQRWFIHMYEIVNERSQNEWIMCASTNPALLFMSGAVTAAQQKTTFYPNKPIQIHIIWFGGRMTFSLFDWCIHRIHKCICVVLSTVEVDDVSA